MRLLTALLSCAMALFGCDTRPATTTITRVVDGGTETLFSKTTLVDGIATFECFSSASGDCHFLDRDTRRCTVYERRPDTCRKHPQVGPKPGYCPYGDRKLSR